METDIVLEFGKQNIDTDYTIKMAAKAIGLSEEFVKTWSWNPLYSQADAFELQSKLRLEVCYTQDPTYDFIHIGQANYLCGKWEFEVTIKTNNSTGQLPLMLGLTVAASKIGEMVDD